MSMEMTPIYGWIVKMIWPFTYMRSTITTLAGTYKIVRMFGNTWVDRKVFK